MLVCVLFGRAHFGTSTECSYSNSLSRCNFILDQIDNLAHSQVAHFYKAYVDHFSQNPVLTFFFNSGIPKGFIILLAISLSYPSYFIYICPIYNHYSVPFVAPPKSLKGM